MTVHAVAAKTYEAPDENPAKRMEARMLRHKQKLLSNPFEKLTDEEQAKAREIAKIPDPEERMDALLNWASEYDTGLAREQIAAATRTQVELSARIGELEEKITEDPLTGTYNRRYLEHELPRAFERVGRSRVALKNQEEGAEENKVEMSLLFIDIDHFKLINDKLGHPTGDKAIKALCTIVNDNLRDEDTLIRWGGEEFIVMLEADTEKAEIVAERIRKGVEVHLKKLLEPHCQDAESQRILKELIDGTASIGIATYSPEDKVMQPADLIAMADAAMYRAKREGRNTLRVYDPTEDGKQLEQFKEARA